MDRKSYSHIELQALFLPAAIILVRYDKVDKEAISANVIHNNMFPGSAPKAYSDFFELKSLELTFNSDKYVRNCIIQLIGTGGEFEMHQSSRPRLYYYFHY